MGFDDYFIDMGSLCEGDVVLRYDDPLRGPGWLLLANPPEILIATDPPDVTAVLQAAAVHAATKWSAGFLTYESASGFGAQFDVRSPDWPVLAWFALFDEPPRFYRELHPVYRGVDIIDVAPDWDESAYRRAFDRVKVALAAGETYQVNVTFRMRFGLDAPATAFFADRCGVDPPKFSTFVHGGEWQVASFSPELMFERAGDRVLTMPMKGTVAAGATRAESLRASQHLAADPKSIAENIMVVDMVRSDLGSVCATGSIETPKLLAVERHRRLLQMVSSVTGRCDAATADLVAALFPAASITGAPKVSTMRVIREIESSPRHVYCGAIGVMTPGWQRFSVAIRTALFRGNSGEFGIGSGVVWDSEPDAEYAECLDKQDLLLKSAPAWELIEALSGCALDDPREVASHIERLAGQARRFGIPFDPEALCEALGALPRTWPFARPKVRIALRLDGTWEITSGPSAIAGDTIHAVLAHRPVCSGDPNLRIKSTSRAVLDAHLDENPDADEVLLFNEHGLLTEFCRGNVVLRIDGVLATPHPSSGCLPGVGVDALVAKGQAVYADLPVSTLERATEIWFINSVTGLIPVRYTPQ